jgi:hypothetical protein
MYDFDIFSFDFSLASLSVGKVILAKLLFSGRKIDVNYSNQSR